MGTLASSSKWEHLGSASNGDCWRRRRRRWKLRWWWLAASR